MRVVASPKATTSAGPADDSACADRADADASSAAATADAAVEALVGVTADVKPDGAQGDSIGAALEDLQVEVIKDVWAFKRAQEMYPSPK